MFGHLVGCSGHLNNLGMQMKKKRLYSLVFRIIVVNSFYIRISLFNLLFRASKATWHLLLTGADILPLER
jgi:hypothetical protein